ncbi:MAG: hypothetical protein HY822_24695 [Acidobacteria bacterium]|nr:hypothetical protein [Acidobacteriota bacterium]
MRAGRVRRISAAWKRRPGLDGADFASGGLNQSGGIRPNRVFKAHESILVCRAGRFLESKLNEVVDRLIAILEQMQTSFHSTVRCDAGLFSALEEAVQLETEFVVARFKDKDVAGLEGLAKAVDMTLDERCPLADRAARIHLVKPQVGLPETEVAVAEAGRIIEETNGESARWLRTRLYFQRVSSRL